jgi:hypothetical protein
MLPAHCGVTFCSITSPKPSIASNVQTGAILLCLQCKKFGLGTPDIAKHCVVGPLLPGTKVKQPWQMLPAHAGPQLLP